MNRGFTIEKFNCLDKNDKVQINAFFLTKFFPTLYRNGISIVHENIIESIFKNPTDELTHGLMHPFFGLSKRNEKLMNNPYHTTYIPRMEFFNYEKEHELDVNYESLRIYRDFLFVKTLMGISEYSGRGDKFREYDTHINLFNSFSKEVFYGKFDCSIFEKLSNCDIWIMYDKINEIFNRCSPINYKGTYMADYYNSRIADVKFFLTSIDFKRIENPLTNPNISIQVFKYIIIKNIDSRHKYMGTFIESITNNMIDYAEEKNNWKITCGKIIEVLHNYTLSGNPLSGHPISMEKFFNIFRINLKNIVGYLFDDNSELHNDKYLLFILELFKTRLFDGRRIKFHNFENIALSIKNPTTFTELVSRYVNDDFLKLKIAKLIRDYQLLTGHQIQIDINLEEIELDIPPHPPFYSVEQQEAESEFEHIQNEEAIGKRQKIQTTYDTEFCPCCYEPNPDLIYTACGHYICERCYIDYDKDECPTCKQKVVNLIKLNQTRATNEVR
jgi:hypothetical protein